MACFLVPVTEAIATTAITKAMEGKEKKEADSDSSAEVQEITFSEETRIPFSKKLKWLNNMLWGGSALLCFEHIWHGEVVPFFPFLTAASNPADAAEMLHEMATVGTSMALLITCVWAGMVLVSNSMEKSAIRAAKISAK